ncbi:hypothetical protein SY94_5014 (plasmid) [Agrobacterium tumefaciens]|nr:hypothetical protein SY94_5014 [Agrobacterium tumefaciens]
MIQQMPCFTDWRRNDGYIPVEAIKLKRISRWSDVS